MKKIVSILLCLVLFAGVLTGCGSNNTQNTGNGKLKIVTTIFPEYDWVRNILGDDPAGGLVAKQAQDADGRFADRVHGPQQRHLFVERLPGVGAKDGGDV